MTTRLQKILSEYGICSRRMAERYITEGRVTVNGETAKLGDSADPEKDTVLIDGRPLPQKKESAYLMLHKPRGFVTTLSDEKGRKTVSELVADCGVRVYPIGRLDMDSEGLLLFTNDGETANALMHPRQEVNKTYLVTVKGYHNAALSLLSRRVTLDGYTIRTPQVKLIRSEGEKTVISVTIHEGRNRQVRRMCALAGLTVTRLKRVSEGSIRLGDLPLGKWRYLTAEEIDTLKKECQ